MAVRIMNVNNKGQHIYAWQVFIRNKSDEVYILNIFSPIEERQLFSEIANSMFFIKSD